MTYDEIRQAMDSQPYHMSLVGDDAVMVREVVNKGIDSRLEACFVPDRGDSFEVEGSRLNCVVSVESMPVLLRRLTELNTDDALMLVGDMLEALGIHDGAEIAFGEGIGDP